MLGLALLASHLVGDYLLQTRWQAERKLDDFAHRLRHVTAYTFAFLPVAIVYAASPLRAALFLALLLCAHFLTDSRRFRSTIGDVVAWRGSPDSPHAAIDKRGEWAEHLHRDRDHRQADDPRYLLPRPVPESFRRWPPPNPWPALPLMVDQTLHVVQLAVLGWLLT